MFTARCQGNGTKPHKDPWGEEKQSEGQQAVLCTPENETPETKPKLSFLGSGGSHHEMKGSRATPPKDLWREEKQSEGQQVVLCTPENETPETKPNFFIYSGGSHHEMKGSRAQTSESDLT